MRRVDLIVGEGATEIAVAQRLLDLAQVDRAHARPLDKRGQGNFWRDIGRYEVAARRGLCVFALADLEHARCPAEKFEEHLPGAKRSGTFSLRIAVRASEAWLLADVEGIARWLRVARAVVPRDPESLQSPKRELVLLARRSPVRWLRESLVPEPGSHAVVGREYLLSIMQYIAGPWDPWRAASASASLRRALSALGME